VPPSEAPGPAFMLRPLIPEKSKKEKRGKKRAAEAGWSRPKGGGVLSANSFPFKKGGKKKNTPAAEVDVGFARGNQRRWKKKEKEERKKQTTEGNASTI